MMRFRKKIICFLVLSSTLFSQKILAQVPDDLIPDFSCLTRDEKESVLNQIEENVACHQALDAAAEQPRPEDDLAFSWTVFLTGAVVGAFVYSSGHK